MLLQQARTLFACPRTATVSIKNSQESQELDTAHHVTEAFQDHEEQQLYQATF